MVATMANGKLPNRGAVACRQKRLAKGWSQAQLAESVGSTQPTVARWEGSVWRPLAGPRLAMAELLGIDWRLWDQASPASS